MDENPYKAPEAPRPFGFDGQMRSTDAGMRWAIVILIVDVTLFLALFVGSTALQEGLGAPIWLTAVFMAPPFAYAWWRGVFPDVRLLDAILFVNYWQVDRT